MENVSSQETQLEKPRAQNFFHVIERKTKEVDWHPFKTFYSYKEAKQIMKMEKEFFPNSSYRMAKYVRSAQIE